jgi:hypothetical protein
MILRGRWCDIDVLNVHAPTEDKSDDIKDRFYEERTQVFDKFPNYHTKILPKWVRKTFGPRHSSSGESLASHRGGPGSNPGTVM